MGALPRYPAENPARELEPEGPENNPPGGKESRGLDQLSERFLGMPAEAAAPCDLRALRAAAEALAASPEEPEPAVEAALATVMEAAGAQAVRLYLLGPQGLLRMRAGRNRWENAPFLALVLRLEAGTLNGVLRCAEPVLMRESFEVSGPPEMAASDEVHCLALPLKMRGQPGGVLLLFGDEPFRGATVGAVRQSAAGLALVIDYLELLAAGRAQAETRSR